MNVDERTLYRAGGWCGIAAMVGLVASLPLAPPWPNAAASVEAVNAYFVTYRSGFLKQAWVACLAVAMLVPYTAALEALCAQRGRPVLGRTLWGATLMFCGAFALNWIPWIAIAFRSPSAESVRALYDFGLLGQFVGVGAPLALQLAAFALIARDGTLLPRWLAAVAVVQVPLDVVLAGCTQVDGPFAPSGPIGFASIGLFTLVHLSAAIAMVRRARNLPAPALS